MQPEYETYRTGGKRASVQENPRGGPENGCCARPIL